MFIDTHCHLYDEKIINNVEDIVAECQKKGVSRIINVACEEKSAFIVKKQAEKYSSVYFAVGFHPSELKGYNDENKEKVFNLLAYKKCVAVGEIGLDYHWESDNKEKQKQCFIEQIEIAYSNKLPINIHIRDAMGDAVEILRQNKGKLAYGGVMHCYSGSVETAKTLLDLGMYISFGGTLTFKNARQLLDVARFVPRDRILTETDSPYLSPEPKRGSVNTPQNIPIIAKRLADIRNVDVEKIAENIFKNSKTLFNKLK